MTGLALQLFLVGLLFASFAALVGRTRRARLISPLLLSGVLVAGSCLAALGFWRGDTVTFTLSSVPPFPFTLAIDRLSALFLLLICAVAVPVAIYSSSYVERHYQGSRRSWFWALLPLFIASMAVVVTGTTVFAFLFGWELMTLFSAALVMIDGDSPERRHNVFIYLVMMHAGAAAVVGAFLLFLPQGATLDFASMRTAAALMPPALRTAIFVLAFVGFSTKAGIVPLHLWLPRAHPIAPSPVSALMSAVMLKTAIYGFVRFGFDLLGAGPPWWGYIVLAAGAVSGVLGILYALGENDLKRLLAYSSVENIGIIYLGLGAALILRAHGAQQWAMLALVAALLHTVNHALFKSALFLGAGSISDAAHTLNLEEMGGLMPRMRFTGAAFLVACCSIAGLPLFNGFVSEWLTFRSFLAGATLPDTAPAIVLPLMVGVLALVGGLSAACFIKVYGAAFLGRPRSQGTEHAHEVPVPMRLGTLLPAAACVLVGVLPDFVLKPLSTTVQAVFGNTAVANGVPREISSLTSVLPWLACGVLIILIAAAAMRRKPRVTPTWACGMQGLDSRMQYTSTALSKPLRRVFSNVYKPERTIAVVPADQPYFPAAMSYSSVRTTSFERSLYRPAVDAIVTAALRLRKLQTGNIQVYLLYMFVALVALLIFMRFA